MYFKAELHVSAWFSYFTIATLCRTYIAYIQRIVNLVFGGKVERSVVH